MRKRNLSKRFAAFIYIFIFAPIFCLGFILFSCESNQPDTTTDAETVTELPGHSDEPATEPLSFSPDNDNNVLKIVTGKNQWEGIKVNGSAMNLEMGKSYSFSFRAYTPDIDVGLIFQTNTVNGWNWNMVASINSYALQPPGWYDITGTLSLGNPDAVDLPVMVLAKLGGDGRYDEVAVFYIDDFVVIDTGSGDIIFTNDFQQDSTLFENNGGSCVIVPETEIYEIPEEFISDRPHALEVAPLKEIYKDYFLLGNIVNPGDLDDTSAAVERYNILKHHYNVLTFENDMKPDAVWKDRNGSYERPEVPTAKLAQIDGCIDKLISDGFKIIGHTLGWYKQSPNWLNIAAGNREYAAGREYKTYSEARENLEIFINTVAGHFYNKQNGSRIYSWDVMTEAVGQNPEKPVTAENWGYHTIGAVWVPDGEQWRSPWYMAYSNQAPDNVNPWDYVYDSFIYARLADPESILYYNDYNMEEPTKVKMVVNMINAVNGIYAAENPDANGRLLIEGIGMQSHDSLPNSGIDNRHFANLEDAIQKYIATGCIISITELDVGVPGYKKGEKLSEPDEIRQGIHFAKLFQIYKKYAGNIERVTFWGINDINWRGDMLCQIFDTDDRAKLGYYAVADPDGFLEQYEGEF